MPELPEIASRASQINRELTGKTIQAVETLQPKCLNLEPEAFNQALTGATITGAHYRGKWIFIETTRGWLLVNEGMGGEILWVTREVLPAKYRLIIDFTDGTCLAINFWWFGSVHFVLTGHLEEHAPTAKLGPNVYGLPKEEFLRILRGQRGRLKNALLDQSVVAGIGNAYIHDILFLAHLHPLRMIHTLTDEDLARLHQAVQDGLGLSLSKGGAYYEVDLHGVGGGFLTEDVLIGYQEGKPCPNCGTPIQKIKTGSTTGYICPTCQPVDP